MNPKGITFTGPMVRAILAGIKTQTRRTSGKPYQPGDVLLVGEAWRTLRIYDGLKPTELPADAPILFEADLEDGLADAVIIYGEYGRYRQARFLPFRFRRLRLLVEAERREPLQQISETDALAEGIQPLADQRPGFNRFTVDVPGWSLSDETAAATYARLWEHIHGPNSWQAQANPVRVITFRVSEG